MNMYYNQTCAAKGETNGNRQRPLFNRSMQRAAVNIFKTENSYELLVFAPGRIKEHFKVELKGEQLQISYTPPEGFVRPEWIHREYSRGGFLRTFNMDDSIDTTAITATYVDGVLQVKLPLLAEAKPVKKEIVIN